MSTAHSVCGAKRHNIYYPNQALRVLPPLLHGEVTPACVGLVEAAQVLELPIRGLLPSAPILKIQYQPAIVALDNHPVGVELHDLPGPTVQDVTGPSLQDKPGLYSERECAFCCPAVHDHQPVLLTAKKRPLWKISFQQATT